MAPFSTITRFTKWLDVLNPIATTLRYRNDVVTGKLHFLTTGCTSVVIAFPQFMPFPQSMRAVGSNFAKAIILACASYCERLLGSIASDTRAYLFHVARSIRFVPFFALASIPGSRPSFKKFALCRTKFFSMFARLRPSCFKMSLTALFTQEQKARFTSVLM